MLNVRKTSDFGKMVGIQKIDVVWQPTYAENDDEHDQHLDNLERYQYINDDDDIYNTFTFCFFRLANSNCGVMIHRGCRHHNTVVMCIVMTPMMQIGMTYVTNKIQTLYLKIHPRKLKLDTSKCLSHNIPFYIHIPHPILILPWKKKCNSLQYSVILKEMYSASV